MEQRREVEPHELSEKEKGATVALKAALYIQWPSVITTTDITSNGCNDDVSLVPAKMFVCKRVFPTDITSSVITTNGYNDAIRMVPLRLFFRL